MSNLDRCSSALQGIIASETIDGILWPRRLTLRQRKYLAAVPMWSMRGECSAGVRLVIGTRARRVTLHFKIGWCVRPWFDLDWNCDGGPTRSLRLEDLPSQEQVGRPWSATFDLPEDGIEHRLEIWLPNLAELGIHSIEADAPWRPLPSTSTRRLLCLGDSITQGMLADGPSGTLAMRLGRRFDAQVLNQGVGGHRHDPGLLDPDLPFEPQVITLAYGTNDWTSSVSVDRCASRARETVQNLRKTWPKAAIVVISPLWRETSSVEGQIPLVDYGAAIRSACADIPAVTVIDGFTLIDHRMDLFADGLHPNSLGFAQYEERLAPVISQVTGWAFATR